MASMTQGADVNGDSNAAVASTSADAAAPAAGSSTQLMDVDDEDEVVQECDIYLNRMYDPPDFVGDLYVLQYPLRPIYRKYGDQGDLDRVDFKAKARRLRFVYNLHQNDNYDDDGIASEKAQEHVLNSVVVSNPACSYAIGVVHNGRMTLTPVRAINQLRPDFEHVDRQASRAARGVSATGGDESDHSGAEDNGAANAMTANPVRVEYTAAGKIKGGSGALAALDAEPEEPWARLDYFNVDTEEAKDIYFKHIVWPAVAAAEAEDEGFEPDHPKLQPLEFEKDSEILLQTMCGQCPRRSERKEAEKEKTEADGLSSYMLSRMPVDRQVEYVVRHFGVVSYSRQLRKRLPPSTMRTHGTDATLLGLLRRCAVLVCGNWVLKSELTGFDGSEAYARDMLLIFFNKKNGVISNEEHKKWGIAFPNTTPAARDEMTRQIADRDVQAGTWKMKSPYDAEFCKRFPDIVQEFTDHWDKKRQEVVQKMAGMRGTNAGGGTPTTALASAAARQRAVLAAEARSALANGAMTTAELRRHLQKKNQRQVIQEEEVKRAMTESNDVIQVRDLWMLGTTGNEANDKFRVVLQSVFKLKDSVTKREILDEYERTHQTKCKLSDYVIRILLREISDRAEGDTFMLKGLLTRDLAMK